MWPIHLLQAQKEIYDEEILEVLQNLYGEVMLQQREHQCSFHQNLVRWQIMLRLPWHSLNSRRSPPCRLDIIQRMKAILEPGGHLVLGAGESLLGLSSDFEQDFVDGAVLYRLKDKAGLAA